MRYLAIVLTAWLSLASVCLAEVRLTRLKYFDSTTDAATYDCGNVTTTGTGFIAVHVLARNPTGSGSITSVSIGGTNGTDQVSNTANNRGGIFTRTVTAGTHNVTVNFSDTSGRCIVAIYFVEGATSEVPLDTALTEGATASSVGMTLDFPTVNAVAVYGAMHGTSGESINWSSATETYDKAVEVRAAFAVKETSGTGNTETASWTTSNVHLGVAAVWESASPEDFPLDWEGKASHSVTTEPGSDLTDFVYYVSLDQLPSGFWEAVQTDGDDIRVTSDETGENQLPVDIINFTDSGSTGTGVIAVKYAGTKSSVTNQPLYVWAGNATATRPGTMNAYGSELVYNANIRAFWPSGGGNDRTRYDNDLTMTGSPTVGGTAGPINGSTATDYDGTTQYGTATAVPITDVPFSMSVWGNSDNDTSIKSLLCVSDTATANYYAIIQDRGSEPSDLIAINTKGGEGSATFAFTSTGMTISTWGQRGGAFNTGDFSRYPFINGVFGPHGTGYARYSGAFDKMLVGAHQLNASASSFFDGDLSFATIYSISQPEAWFAYEKEMLDDPDQSDFFGTWTWDGGSAPVITTDDEQTLEESERAVVTMTATGAGPITWAIIGGADELDAAIDADTGALILSGSADFENPGDANADNIYEVLVEATGGVEPPAELLMLITVTDEVGGGVVNPLRGGTVR